MIKEIRLTNFKTFKQAIVSFGPLSLVLGANGVGKSNLFDALRLLKSVGDGQSIRDAIEGHVSYAPGTSTVSGVRGGSAAITNLDTDDREFRLEITILQKRNDLRYSIGIDSKSYRVTHEELSAKSHPGPYVFSTHPDTGPLEHSLESPGIAARFYKATRGLNPRREFSPHSSLLSQFRGRQAESRLNEDVAEMARRELASLQHLELRPEVLRQYSALGRFELGEHGENFAAVVWQLLQDARREQVLRQRVRRTEADRKELERELENLGESTRGGRGVRSRLAMTERREAELRALSEPLDGAESRLAAINAWLGELSPQPVKSISVQEAPTGEQIFALQESDQRPVMSARSLSDGTLRFAALAFAALAPRGRRTLVVEELENGINPARLALLTRMLELTADESEGVQVLASTHSPSILDFASEETISNSTVIGWDDESRSSHPVGLATLPHINEILADATLGSLQAEGWLQHVAGTRDAV
jgi:predicted ATPase